jgi:predicted HTH transcriptional regulator
MIDNGYLKILKRSLQPIAQELNELDWKEGLSSDKDRLKEHLSAFANYPGGGYLVFGIRDDGTVLGVDEPFCKQTTTKIANLAADAFEQRVQISSLTETYQGKSLLIIRIDESTEKPVHIRGKSIEHAFIRSGGQTRKMSKQDIRAAIINSRTQRFEELPALIDGLEAPLDNQFDFSEVLRRTSASSFTNEDARNEHLFNLKLLTKINGKYRLTNLGLLLCSKDLTKINGFERYSIRINSYSGSSKMFPSKENIFSKGFSFSIDQAVTHIINIIPHSEILKKATRLNVPVIPEIAIRELLGNAVIHRDYGRSDSYTNVDVFSDRIEINNPGGLVGDVTTDRLIDHPARTRNEVLADAMKHLNFYEERGSGIDKTITAIETWGLPPVSFRAERDHFLAVLFQPKDFDAMEREQRIDAAYQHACLNFVCNRKTTNTTVRERFKFDESKMTKVYRLIKDAIDEGRLKISDPNAGRKYINYLPYWA